MQADWVVFSMLDVDDDRPQSNAIHRLLEERPDLTDRKQLVTFAFNAPYFLDATDISKLTAYYGLYSKTPAFVDVAARILFGELTPLGALPVSVPGSGYDLARAVSPEPSQVIPLNLDIPDENAGVGTEPVDVLPMFEENDILPLETGTIYDRNRHIVPDGTAVDFVFSTGGKADSYSRSARLPGMGLPVRAIRSNQLACCKFRCAAGMPERQRYFCWISAQAGRLRSQPSCLRWL